MSDEQASSVHAILDEGKRAYAAGNFRQAIELLARALQEAREAEMRSGILLALANAHDELGERESALSSLKELIDEDPDAPEPWNNLGVICQKMGKLDEALAAFEKACRLDPDNPRIHINLGSIALKRSDPGNAKKYLERALEMDSTHPLAHANMALTLTVFGRIEEAEEHLRLAVLHGFNGAEPIQQRIDQMKVFREKTLAGRAAGKDEKTGDPGRNDAVELLGALERELLGLIESKYHAARGGDQTPEAAERIVELRRQIRALRRALSIDEVLETDVFMGHNYMAEEP